MRPVLLWPAVEVLEVGSEVASVVVRRGKVVVDGQVVRVELANKLSGIPAHFFPDDIESLVGSEAVELIGLDLWEELFEQVVALQDGASSIS